MIRRVSCERFSSSGGGERLPALRVLVDRAVDRVVEEIGVAALDAVAQLGEEQPGEIDVGEHRGAAVVDQQHHLDAVEQVAAEDEIDLAAVPGALIDRGVEVELIARPRGASFFSDVRAWDRLPPLSVLVSE